MKHISQQFYVDIVFVAVTSISTWKACVIVHSRTHSMLSYNWEAMNSQWGLVLFMMYWVWQIMKCKWIFEFCKAHWNVFPPTCKFKSVWRYTEAPWWSFDVVFCSLCATGGILCSDTYATLWKGNALPCINKGFDLICSLALPQVHELCPSHRPAASHSLYVQCGVTKESGKPPISYRLLFVMVSTELHVSSATFAALF